MIRIYKLDGKSKFYLEAWGQEGTVYTWDPYKAFEFGNVEGAEDVAEMIGKDWDCKLYVEET